MSLKEGVRYSCHMKVPFECKSIHDKSDFYIFFSCKVLKLNDDTVITDMYNPVIIRDLLRKYPEFYIFVPEKRELVECQYIETSKNGIVVRTKDRIPEKRKSFRILLCDSDFYINEPGDIDVLDISYTGVRFVYRGSSKDLGNPVRLINDERTIDVEVLGRDTINGESIIRGKIVSSNFNISRFISERYIQTCKEIIKRECKF